MLKAFSADLSASKDSFINLKEAELLGRLGGFLTTVDTNLEINREVILKDRLQPDLILKKNSEDVIVEIKRLRKLRGFTDSAIIQISNYLTAAKLKYGVLYIPPFETNQEMNIRRLETASGREIVILSPKRIVGEDNVK